LASGRPINEADSSARVGERLVEHLDSGTLDPVTDSARAAPSPFHPEPGDHAGEDAKDDAEEATFGQSLECAGRYTPARTLRADVVVISHRRRPASSAPRPWTRSSRRRGWTSAQPTR